MQSGAFSFESKGDASMEYGMIAFLADETDVVEDVLLILSGFFPERRIKGYPVDVADSLRRGLSFFEEAEEGKELTEEEKYRIEIFNAYKEAKEKEIKRIADVYMYEKGGKDIPQFHRVYQAMYNYQVEITD